MFSEMLLGYGNGSGRNTKNQMLSVLEMLLVRGNDNEYNIKKEMLSLLLLS